MSDSPYAPPRTSVADIEPAAPAPPRPAAIDLAVTLIWIDFGIGITASVLQLAKLQVGAGLALAAAIYIIVFGISAWVYVGVTNGRNWARNAYFILIALSFFGTAAVLLRHLRPGDQQSALDILLALAGLCLEIYAVVLLLGRPAREWFHEMKGRG